MAYQRPGMSDFALTFGANQGIAVNLLRDNTNTALPILLRNQPALPAAPTATYPILPTSITNTVNAFDVNLQIPYTQSYTVGWQRQLGRDTAIEFRYVGSRHRQDWETVNLNEISITDNGFLSEFRKAQANLQANMAAGRGATFAYTGAAGTSPLPIFLAYFNGQGNGRAGDATQYSGANWTNSSFLGYLAAQNPNPFGFMCNNAGGCTTATLTNGFIGTTTFRNNAAAAGLPANLFLANPDVIGGANLTTKHALKANWLYELPFGEEQRFGNHFGRVLDRLVGGWSIDGVARIQTGQMLDFGDVRVDGMSVEEFRKAVGLRVGANGQVYILPQDIIDDTVKAFNVSATSPDGYGATGAPTGRYLAPANGPSCIETEPSYGDCGVRSLVVNGPPLVRFDLSLIKRVRVKGNVNFEFRGEFLNAFNTPYFDPAAAQTRGMPLGFTTNFTAPQGPFQTATPYSNSTAGNSSDSFRLTQLLGDNTSRIVQLVFRVRW